MDKKEIWKPIPEYNGRYWVSNMGRVKSYSRKKPYFLSTKKVDSHNYSTVSLVGEDGKIHTKLLHRFVARLFVPNPENKPQVNHIDGDRTNAKASNLEWTTAQENLLHARIFLGNDIHDKSNRKAVLCVETSKIFPSVREASRQTGIPRCDLSRCCHKKEGAKTAGGYHWAFVGDPLPDMSMSKRGASVIKIETGEHFNSYKEAGRNVSRSGTSISKACKTGGLCGGYHWKSFYSHEHTGNINKPVRCVETGKIYPSAWQASNELGKNSNHIGDSIRRGTKAYGYHWEWARSRGDNEN